MPYCQKLLLTFGGMVVVITKAFEKFFILAQRKLRLIFILLFTLGIVIGACLSGFVHNSLLSLVHTAGRTDISFWGLFAVLLMPLLISFMAFYFNIPILILPVAFIKAVIFGFCGCCIVIAYEDAGWLVRLLLLFSDSAMLVVLCWYWLQHLDGDRIRLKRNTFLCLWFALIIGITDYMYISPFTALLLQR